MGSRTKKVQRIRVEKGTLKMWKELERKQGQLIFFKKC